MNPMTSTTGAPAGGQTTETDFVGLPTPIMGNLTELLSGTDSPAAPPAGQLAQGDASDRITAEESTANQGPEDTTALGATQPAPGETAEGTEGTEGTEGAAGESAEGTTGSEEVVLTPEDQQLYDSIADEARRLYPTADPSMLKRWIDDKFMVKKLLAQDEKKSKQISQLLKRVTKKDHPARVVTEFERSLAQATAEPPPAAPGSGAAAAQGQNTAAKQPAATSAAPGEQGVPEHLRWQSPIDFVVAEEQAWADYTNPEATPQQRFEAARRLDEIRDYRAAMTVQRYLQSINLDALVETKAQELIQAQLGDVIPAVRQTAAERAALANHEFAIAELTKAGVEGVTELMKPISQEPLIVDGKVYDNHPYNIVALRFPALQNIRVTHDAAGRPYPPDVADRLTRIERYRTAAELWEVVKSQTPAAQAGSGAGTQAPAAAVQQAFQAGMQSNARATVDRARQALNAGSGATTLAAKPAERSFLDDFRESGAIDYSFLHSQR